jgi:hypothetical protein
MKIEEEMIETRSEREREQCRGTKQNRERNAFYS